jgi:hypothetical protein
LAGHRTIAAVAWDRISTRFRDTTLRHVEAYLLSRLKAARRLVLPGFVRWYGIGYHSLLIARVMRQNGV